MSDFENRLRKNAKHREGWARRQGLTAYRLYDLDMPEYPFAVDRYGEYLHVMEYPSRKQRRDAEFEAIRQQVSAACTAVTGVPEARQFFKTHAPQTETQKYARQSAQSVVTEVDEAGARFEVNLSDFLDVGLFLDHRPLRLRVRKEIAGRRLLNLFAYTGAFTVHAALGQAASTTTVDLSAQYCSWAERNLVRNGFTPGPAHRVICDDVFQWLNHTRERFDVIVLDPPSFSTSKKMARSFDVQRDHERLLATAREKLDAGGTLYFSTNRLDFELSDRVQGAQRLTNTLPDDFRREVHQAWRLSAT